MPTAAERQALAFLAGVALLGGGVRVWQQRHHQAGVFAEAAFGANGETVDGQLNAIDAGRASKRGKKGGSKTKAVARKSAASQRKVSGASDERVAIIDVDIASADELEKLPRVGKALAERIVANRDSLGAFGSLEALGSVRGIGDAMLKLLEPLVTFSARPRAASPVDARANTTRRKRTKSGTDRLS